MAIKIKKIEDINPQAEPELKPMPLKEDYEIDPSIPFENKITANDYNTLVTNVETIYNTQKVVSDSVDKAIEDSNAMAKEIQDFYSGIKYTAFPRGSVTTSGDYPVEIGGNSYEYLKEVYEDNTQIASMYIGRFTITTRGSIWAVGTASTTKDKTATIMPQMMTLAYKYKEDNLLWMEFGCVSEPLADAYPVKYATQHGMGLKARVMLDTSSQKASVRFSLGQTILHAEGSTPNQIYVVAWEEAFLQPADFREQSIWFAKKQAINFNNINQG